MPDLPLRLEPPVVNLLRHYLRNPQGQSHIRAWMRRAGRYDPLLRAAFRRAYPQRA
jgi:hypothetical protein